MARLILTLNNKVLGSQQVRPGEQVTIGRLPDNQICIDNSAVSARHAAVRMEGRKMVIRDLGSQNGTFVNDQQITECALGHQDWIVFGKYICIVDLYESLSLRVTETELRKRSSAIPEADGTMLVDRLDFKSAYLNVDYLSFPDTGRQDYELHHGTVSIGADPESNIRIDGLWSILAGKPSATITRVNGVYIVEHIGGMLKTRVNDIRIQRPTRLNDQDVIRIGPLKMKIRCIRLSSKQN